MQIQRMDFIYKGAADAGRFHRPLSPRWQIKNYTIIREHYQFSFRRDRPRHPEDDEDDGDCLRRRGPMVDWCCSTGSPAERGFPETLAISGNCSRLRAG